MTGDKPKGGAGQSIRLLRPYCDPAQSMQNLGFFRGMRGSSH